MRLDVVGSFSKGGVDEVYTLCAVHSHGSPEGPEPARR